MNVDFAKWVEQGPMIMALAIAVVYFVRRELRADRRLDGAIKKCEDREGALVERLRKCEDRQYDDGKELQLACMKVIETNSRTLEQLTKIETDRYKANKA